MELGAPDASGRRPPRALAGSDFVVPGDLVLVAFGFDALPLSSGDAATPLVTDRWGSLKVDANQMTNLPGVFAGGDSVRGPSLVAQAVWDGRNAAQGIERYLQSTRKI
jgi:glutamate synthase (NADPH/NADH) small chain